MGNWTANFIYAIMIIILIQMLSPEGKFDKHIKLASSLMFVIAVFIPAIEFIRSGDIETQFLKESLYVDSVQVSYDVSETDSIYKTTLLTDYKNNLVTSIKSQLETDMNFQGSIYIEVEEDESDEDFASVKKIRIIADSEINEQKAKKILNDFYNISEDNIYISVNN